MSAHPVEGLPYVLVPDPRRALALMAGNFFRHPDRELSLIGVTGTNGKTSVAWLTAGLFQALGIPTGLMGTNGCRIGGAVLPAAAPPRSPGRCRVCCGRWPIPAAPTP